MKACVAMLTPYRTDHYPQAIETHGRKRTRTNVVRSGGRIDASALVGVVAGWLFNYNTVEQMLLASAIVVCLLCIMFVAAATPGAGTGSSASWTSGIAALTINIIAITIVYWATVVLTDIYFLWADAQSRAAVTRARAAGSKKLAGTTSSRASHSSRRRVVAEIGAVDTAINPLFVTGAASGSSGADNKNALAEALRSSTAPPPPELWAMMRGSFMGLLTQVRVRHCIFAFSVELV